MSYSKVSIRSIEIERFKKIRNLNLEPKEGGNLFYGSYRSGKTSLCEFIQFVLYGSRAVALARDNAEDAMGKIVFEADGKLFSVERSVIAGCEESVFLNLTDGESPETELTPGEYLTGLDEDDFDLITYFKQARYESPVFKPKFSFLHRIASFGEDTKNLYEEYLSEEEKKNQYTNAQGTGLMDRLCAERDALKQELEDRPSLEEEAESCAKSLADIARHLDENDRRCVLLKADMAGHADDLQLSLNKENAEELRGQILAKEKKMRFLSYNVANKVGKLERAELEELKEDYNRLSLAVTALNESRMALSAAEENLSFHEGLFVGDDTEEHYYEAKRSIRRAKAGRLILRILGGLMLAGSVPLFLLFSHLHYSHTVSLACGGASGILGVALICVSMLFTSMIRKVLAENGKESCHALYEFYDRLVAHGKTTHVYRDQVMMDRARMEKREEEHRTVQAQITEKVSALGYTEEDGEILAICDDIIEANDSLYDLEEEIEADKKEYTRLLSVDVSRTDLAVSPEFAALQKELAFLSVQNDSLYKKKALISARYQTVQELLSHDPEQLKEQLSLLTEKIEAISEEEVESTARYRAAKEKKDAFEGRLKEEMAKNINEKLRFMLGEGESFLFDDHFELCWCDQRSVLPLIRAGGGVISEMGLFAFRLTLAQFLKKTDLPMIFDDTFATMDPAAAGAVYAILRENCSQFLIASSSPDVYRLCQNTAKIFPL